MPCINKYPSITLTNITLLTLLRPPCTTTTTSDHHIMKHNATSIPRNNSYKTIQSTYITATLFMYDPTSITDHKPLVAKNSLISFRRISKLIRSFLTVISLPIIIPTFRPHSLSSLTPSMSQVTGTLFGNRRGHMSFAVQCDPRSAPVLIIEFAVSTAVLVRDMSSGRVRIVLECGKGWVAGGDGELVNEPVWTMYCNGRRCGYALTKACSESDWHVLRMVESVSVGAGVIPVVEDGRKSGGGGDGGESEGELVYMRTMFERVMGSCDSEAYYMMNPDRNGGAELSIFLLRV